MDVNRMTHKVQEALQAAGGIATRRNHQGIDVEHLLLALLEQEGGLAPAILERSGAQVSSIRDKVEAELNKLPRVSGSGPGIDQVYVTARVNKLYAKAEDEAKQLKDEFISVEHFLVAMLDEGRGGAAGRIFLEAGVTREVLRKAIAEVRGKQRE